MKVILTLFLLVFVSCKNKTAKNTRNSKKPTIPTTSDNNPTSRSTPAPVPPTSLPVPEPPVEPLPLCEKLCDQGNDNLKGFNNDYNYLSFTNFGYRGVGRCRGHAIVSQKMIELSEFKPKSDLCGPKNIDLCIDYYQNKVSEIMSFKVARIEGFQNLLEFSSHPRIKEMLMSHVRSISHKYSAGAAHVEDPIYDDTRVNYFYESLRRVKENQLPYIGIKGEGVGHHAVLGYHVEYINGEEVLCVRDPNFLPDVNEGEQCLNYMRLVDSSIYYNKNGQSHLLYIFSLTNDEDKRVAKYRVARYNYCIKTKRKAGECQ